MAEKWEEALGRGDKPWAGLRCGAFGASILRCRRGRLADC